MQDSQALRKQIRNSVYLQEEKAVRELALEKYLSNIQKKWVQTEFEGYWVRFKDA